MSGRFYLLSPLLQNWRGARDREAIVERVGEAQEGDATVTLGREGEGTVTLGREGKGTVTLAREGKGTVTLGREGKGTVTLGREGEGREMSLREQLM